MAFFRSSEQDPAAPQWLRDHVQNCICQHLLIGCDLSGALGEEPDDGIQGPDDDECEGDLVVEVANLGGSNECVRSGGANQCVVDVGESHAGEDVEAPSVVEGWVESGNETSDDHDDVCDDDNDDFTCWETSEESQVEEQQWSAGVGSEGQLKSTTITFVPPLPLT